MNGEDGVISMKQVRNNVPPRNIQPNNIPPRVIPPKKVPTRKNYTEAWLPIKEIKGGIITNAKGEKITGVKIQPNNIFILEQNLQDSILISLKDFYNMLDFEFWIFVTDRPVDISLYMSNLQLLFNDTQDQRIRKIIAQDMEKGQTCVNNDVVDTEYYLLFKEKKDEIIQKRIRMLITGLAGCRISASQTTNDDLRAILDSFLNGSKKYNSGTVIAQ